MNITPIFEVECAESLPGLYGQLMWRDHLLRYAGRTELEIVGPNGIEEVPYPAQLLDWCEASGVSGQWTHFVEDDAVWLHWHGKVFRLSDDLRSVTATYPVVKELAKFLALGAPGSRPKAWLVRRAGKSSVAGEVPFLLRRTSSSRAPSHGILQLDNAAGTAKWTHLAAVPDFRGHTPEHFDGANFPRGNGADFNADIAWDGQRALVLRTGRNDLPPHSLVAIDGREKPEVLQAFGPKDMAVLAPNGRHLVTTRDFLSGKRKTNAQSLRDDSGADVPLDLPQAFKRHMIVSMTSTHLWAGSRDGAGVRLTYASYSM